MDADIAEPERMMTEYTLLSSKGIAESSSIPFIMPFSFLIMRLIRPSPRPIENWLCSRSTTSPGTQRMPSISDVHEKVLFCLDIARSLCRPTYAACSGSVTPTRLISVPDSSSGIFASKTMFPLWLCRPSVLRALSAQGWTVRYSCRCPRCCTLRM